MKRFAIVIALMAACVMAADPEPVVEEAPVVEAKEVACAGSRTYYKWKCDTMIGKWTYVPVGTMDVACDGSWDLDGELSSCFTQNMDECGGGDANCQQEHYCQRPSIACERVPVDPPPCCLGF